MDSVQGNALNGSGTDPTLERDARGMSLLLPERSRTPTGWLYAPPYETRQAMPFGGEWNYRLSIELGAVQSSGDAPTIRNHGDLRDGVVLNYFNFGLDRAGAAQYFDLTGGAAGRKDQHYRATIGRHGDYRMTLYFSQIPTLLADRARTVFHGAGSGSLTLAAGLAPGGNTPAQLAAALDSAPKFELGFTRRKSGLDFESTPGGDWRIYARYTREGKSGTRPLGGASSYPGAPVVEAPEPIDYRTHTLHAGAQWAGDAFQANLGYAGSFFRNAVDTLTWENPVALGNPAALQRTRFDLYPDNDSHNLRLDVSAALPLRGRVSGGVSWTRMTQNDSLIAPTVNSGIVGGVGLANWNTTAALSRASAGARIDTRLIHVSGAFSPLRDLSLQARLRRYEEDNRTRYSAFNPLTGQFGYLGLDGANNSNIVPGLFRVPLQNVPFEHRRDHYGVDADYRLLRRTNFTLGYERENNRDPYREYARTGEGRIRAALNNRDVPWATIRLSYEQATRRGENYNHDPNRIFYSESALINAPATLAGLRQYDIADRRQQVLSGRVNFLVARDMDLGVSGRYLDNVYRAAYGRLGERIAALTLEWNWQPRPGATAYAHYGFERRRNRMAQISDDPAGWASGDPNAGGAVYPLANRWEEDSRDDAHHLGLGFRYAFARATLESGYTWFHSPYRTRYSFASPGALAGGAAAAGGAGDAMPDIVFRQQALETSLRLRIDKDMALRLHHRYERTRIDDWHHDGLPPAFGNNVFLGAGPRSYSAHLLGVFFQYAPGTPEKTGR